jgi:hypothetical protein
MTVEQQSSDAIPQYLEISCNRISTKIAYQVAL